MTRLFDLAASRMGLGWRTLPRIRLAATVAHAPNMLRALVRADELWLIVLAAASGVAAGLCVTLMGIVTQAMHGVLYGLDLHERLSSQEDISTERAAVALVVGGVVVGLFTRFMTQRWPRRAVDPIEANALHGGRMSIRDSLIVVIQTVLSNGFGASVGLEAGYTQIGSAIAAKFGRALRVRRGDLRLLVGCGAAGAIAAAFNAPLTGAFYAFELVMGTYAIATLAPIMAASLSAVLVVRWISPDLMTFDIRAPTTIETSSYPSILLLGLVCAGCSILLMRSVTLTEDIFRRSGVAGWLRPAIGGLIVAGLAFISPQVLSSGHSALQVGLDAPYPVRLLVILILIKALASAISIGSGFRGGLFFASLFLGALIGKLYAAILALIWTVSTVPPIVCAVAAMSALAVGVVGGPLTMSFLALETTGSLPLTAAVVAASLLCSITVRRTFGYSFATWRFHLRGEQIRSPVDVGWVRSLTVERMMRKEVRIVPVYMRLSDFRHDFPLGAASQVVVVDRYNRYLGLMQVSEGHGARDDGSTRLDSVPLHDTKMTLRPDMTIKEALDCFATAESDALAVLDNEDDRMVIGLLTEQYALRRYTDELERRRRELSGE
jgi:chloride channel protein, CIC family